MRCKMTPTVDTYKHPECPHQDDDRVSIGIAGYNQLTVAIPKGGRNRGSTELRETAQSR